MHTEYDVIIVGGGLSGLQMAVCLGMHHIRVCVVDKTPVSTVINSPDDGRTCAIAYASVNLFKHTGVWDLVGDEACPMHHIRIEDGDLIKGLSYFSMQYDRQLVDGEDLGYIVENNTLRRCQYARLQSLPTVTYLENRTVTDFVTSDNMATITLDNGTYITTKLVIGADGKFSKMRHMVGIKVTQWQYDQTAIVCTLNCEKPHNNTALELFLPSGPFASLPLSDNRMSIVWSEKTALVNDLLALSEGDFNMQLQHRMGDWLGKVSVCGNNRWSYPLSLMHAHTYISNRFCLIADSAHAMHPIAGQGFNMGVRDIAALTEVVTNAYKGCEDWGAQSVLKQYEQYRYADNTALVMICDGLTRLFSNNNSILKTARVLGLGALDKVPFAKKIFMKHAMGTLGTHIPPLLK